MVKRRSATSFGVIVNRTSGKISRVFNPDFEFELDLHNLNSDEFMLRLKKEDYGISKTSDSMSLNEIYDITKKLGS